MSAPDLLAVLADPTQSGAFYIDAGDLEPLMLAAADVGLQSVSVNLGSCRGKPELLQCFVDALMIPAGFGYNWDALADSLADLSWLPAPGYVVGLEQTQALQRAQPDEFAALVGVLEDTCETWRARGAPFWAFIAATPAEFDALPD
jgi:hypothetical protein